MSLLFVFLLAASMMRAEVPENYYQPADGLTGYELKTALSGIITAGHISRGYSALWEGYYTTDRDSVYEKDGSLLDIYSEDPFGEDRYNYSLGSDQCGNYSGEGSCYNREHLMPQSWFDEQSPMKDDIHAVYPTDGYVNGQRGHLPFGEVTNATYTSYNGSKKGNNAYDYPTAYRGEVFEPIDEFKGDIARVYFYMATRYEDRIASWENVNDGSQNTLNGTSDQVFEDWMLAMLLEWHHADPVSQREWSRNDAAFEFQGNRNPFIDHPSYADLIWNPDPDTEAPSIPSDLSVSNISWSSAELSWAASSDNVGVDHYIIKQDGTVVGTLPQTKLTLTGLLPQTTYSIVVYAVDASGNLSDASQPLVFNTLSQPVYLIFEDFDNCMQVTDNFVAVSELSDIDWTCMDEYGENNSGAMQMNAYDNGQVPSTDWLITARKINFDEFSAETLNFFTASRYGDTRLELLYSSDYDGGAFPSSFTWERVPNVDIPLHTGSTTRELSFTDLDVSAIEGSVYLAFKYDTNNNQEATRWTIDNFILSGQLAMGFDFPERGGLTIFPNPNGTGHLHVELENPQAFCYTLCDLIGRMVKHGHNEAYETDISLEGIPGGIYLIQITTEGYSMREKVVILP
jgi:endonuclease I